MPPRRGDEHICDTAGQCSLYVFFKSFISSKHIFHMACVQSSEVYTLWSAHKRGLKLSTLLISWIIEALICYCSFFIIIIFFFVKHFNELLYSSFAAPNLLLIINIPTLVFATKMCQGNTFINSQWSFIIVIVGSALYKYFNEIWFFLNDNNSQREWSNALETYIVVADDFGKYTYIWKKYSIS